MASLSNTCFDTAQRNVLDGEQKGLTARSLNTFGLQWQKKTLTGRVLGMGLAQC